MKNWLNYNEYSLRPKVGDVRFTTIDNVNLDKEIILTKDRQIVDSSVAPLLYEKEGFKGASGILSLDNPVDDIISLESGEKLGNMIIEKNDNELYLLSTTDIGSNNTVLKVYRILNRDFSNPLKIIEIQFTTNVLTAIPCFKGDELHIVIGDNGNIRYYIYDTLNDIEILTLTTVTGGENPTSIRYIESKNEVVFTATITTNSSRLYSVTSQNNFILQNSIPLEPKRVNYNNAYVFRCDKNGTNNFYDNKLWFFNEPNNVIYSFNVNTYEYTLEKNISADITLPDNIAFSFCQVTENGTFYFIVATDNTNNKIEIFTAKNGDLNNSSMIIQDIIDFPIGSYLNLMDDNSAIIKLSSAVSSQPDTIHVTYDLNETVNPFSVLITPFSTRNVSYSVTKNNDKLYIVYSTTSTGSNDIRYIDFDMTESDGALIIPAAPSTDNLIVTTIRKEI